MATTLKTPLLVKQKPFALYMLIAAMLGWIASVALILERIQLYLDPNHVASCDVNRFISCSSVMKSDQASLFGFPNPFFGIVAFTIVITLAVVLLNVKTQLSTFVWAGLQIGITLGLGLVGFFFYTSVFVLNTLCPYCMLAWLSTIMLFFSITGRNVYASKLSPKIKEHFGSWSSIYAWLVIIGMSAIIFFKFFIPMFT